MASAVPLPGVRISLRDVAREVGVSHVAVSMALRGDPRISAPRRREIAAAAERMGYRPDPMLSALSAYRRSKGAVTVGSTIAWINQWKDPKSLRRLHEFEAYWNGAGAAAARLGYRLEEFVVNRDVTSARLLRILVARGVRGILIPPHEDPFDLPGFEWSLFSVVRLGISVKHPRAHVVTSNQMKCASLALEKILERGHRRIGYVTSRRFDRKTGGNFRAGYLSTQDAAVPLKRHLPPLFLEDESSAKTAARLRAWMQKFSPDALISTEMELAPLLKHLGCRVPEDLAVAALSVLDGNFDAGVDQNSLEVGSVAVQTLASLIHQHERGVPRYCRQILVEGRWVDGNSLP